MTREYPSFKLKRTVEIRELVSFFCHKYPPGFVFKGETHNFWEFVIVLDGAAVICADDKVFRLNKGQAMWHRPWEFHSVKTDGDAPLYFGVFSFYGKIDAPVSGKSFAVSPENVELFIKLRLEAGSIFNFHGIEGERPIIIKNLRPGKEIELQSLISRMEYLLADTMSGYTVQPEKKPSASEENYLRIVETISKNIGTRLSIDEIAMKCNMSVSNAKRVFSKYAGCGISVYYNGLIIYEAKKLLSDGKSVGETADALGFASQNYFSSFFKRITGYSPSEWRTKSQR